MSTQTDRKKHARKELSRKQVKFCNEYLKDLNATQAAIRSNYSEKTAYAIAHENLRKPEIQAKIDDILNSVYEKIDEKWLIKEAYERYQKAKRDENEQYAQKYLEMFFRAKTLYSEKHVHQTKSGEDYLDEVLSQISSQDGAQGQNTPEPDPNYQQKEKVSQNAHSGRTEQSREHSTNSNNNDE